MGLMARDLRNLASPTSTSRSPSSRHEPGRPDRPVGGQGEARRRPERPEHHPRALLPGRQSRTALPPDPDLGERGRSGLPRRGRPAPGPGWTRHPGRRRGRERRAAAVRYNAADLGDHGGQLAPLRRRRTRAQPAEVALQTSVFLRNQNRAPTASFTWAADAGRQRLPERLRVDRSRGEGARLRVVGHAGDQHQGRRGNRLTYKPPPGLARHQADREGRVPRGGGHRERLRERNWMWSAHEKPPVRGARQRHRHRGAVDGDHARDRLRGAAHGRHPVEPVAHRARARVLLQPRGGRALGRRPSSSAAGARAPQRGRTPQSCPVGSSGDFCPDQDQLMRSYDGAGQVDFEDETVWSTQVRDDVDPLGNTVTLLEGRLPRRRHVAALRQEQQPSCLGSLGGGCARREARAIVAWVKIEDRIVSFPRYAILSGYLHGKNSGGHGGRPLVNSTGSLGVAVRCNHPPQSDCIDLNPTKGPQLQPPGNFTTHYPNPFAIGHDDLLALEDVAQANGTWYENGCPPDPNGDVVYVKNAASAGTPTASAGAGCDQVLQQVHDPWALHHRARHRRLRRQHRVLGRDIPRQPRQLVGRATSSRRPAPRDPRRRDRGRQRRRLGGLERRQHRVQRIRVRRHQGLRHRRRRPEHLARDRASRRGFVTWVMPVARQPAG